MKSNLSERIQELEKQVEEWKGKYLRALADYHNLEKRSGEEKSTMHTFAAEMVLKKLLPIADTFERAQAHLNDEGLGFALKEFESFLTNQGVKKISVVGTAFDPGSMECIEVVDGQKGQDNMVVSEESPGYTLYGKVIRVSRVKVGKKADSANTL
jgi:molecular chaperone GrpE